MMGSRDTRHILEAIERINRYVGSMDRDEFDIWGSGSEAAPPKSPGAGSVYLNPRLDFPGLPAIVPDRSWNGGGES